MSYSSCLLRSALATMVAATFIFPFSSMVSAQTAGEFTSLILSESSSDPDFEFFPFDDNFGLQGLGFRAEGNASIAVFRDDAAQGSFSLGPQGVGIGLSAFDINTSENAQAALHIVGGQTDFSPFLSSPAFPRAEVIIEDRNESTSGRRLLTLTNNGTSSIRLTDRSLVNSRFDISSGENGFTIGGTTTENFIIDPIANNTRLAIFDEGVGINTLNPEAGLHVRNSIDDSPVLMVEARGSGTETRNMIDVVNNGPMIQQFTDTSTADPGVFQLESRSDRFSVLQLGNRRAGFAVFEDGAVRFVADSQPNVTVTPNGSLNVVGSGPGGGNLRVGLGSNIGPNDGNIIAQGNITAVGNVNVGGVLNQSSDVNIKEGFQEIDAKEILRKVKNLPITRWNYIQDENDTAHIGPMAQDFAAAFKLGHSDKHISTIDSEGISLAAIKGLSLIMDEKDSTISAQADEIAKQADEIAKQADENSKQADEISDLQSDLDEMKAELSELKSLLIEDFKQVKARVSTLN